MADLADGICPAGGARIYYAQPDDLGGRARARLMALLSDDERARHGRFRFERDRDLYLLAHGMLRLVLGAHAGAAPEALVFRVEPQGRPELASPQRTPPLRFNLTHTQGLVACGVAQGRAIGVDAEGIGRDPDIRALSARVFSAQERRRIDESDGDAARRRFFEHWTLKEAYVKAVGMGLSLPLRQITAMPAADGTARLQLDAIDDDEARWCLRLHRVGETHQLAVVLEAEQTAPIAIEAFPLGVLAV